MTVVVTGASGFIGTHLVQSLLGRGERVVGIDRRPPTVDHPSFVAVCDDLVDPDHTTLDALRDAAAVAHLAARPGVRDTSPGIARLRHLDNVVATERVLAAVPPATPLVVTSSSSVYGGSRRGRASREDDPLQPRGGYARSKAEAEARCGRRAATGGCVTVARPFTVVGEGQRPDMALARWVADASAGGPLVVYGSLDRRRDVTDVRDVVRALVVLLDRAPVTTVNVGTGVARTLGQLVAAVQAEVAPAVVDVRPLPVPEPDATLADPWWGAKVYGFSPATDVSEVVRRVLASQTGDAGAQPLRLVS